MGPIQVVVEDGNNLVLEVTPTPNTTVILDRGIAGPPGPMGDGDVDGPASSTDNAVARFDGTTGKLIQNSVVTIADSTGNMAGVGTLGVGAITTSGALTYGGVTLNNAVTGTGNMVLSNSPTLVTPALGTPASGVVTNLTGTASININGTVGATTASTGAFTTLTTSSTVTLNGGTANGVAFLSGSKVLTTGSALVFDGSFLGLNRTSAWASEQFGISGSSSTQRFIYARSTSAGHYLSLGTNGTAPYIEYGNGAGLIFQDGAAEQMRLTSTGLGIGTSSPESKLAVKGSSGDADLFSISDTTVPTSGGEYGVGMIKSNSTEYMLNITSYNANGKGLRIYHNGGTAANYAFYVSSFSGDRLILDGVGNLGLGVTPSAWGSGYKVLQLGNSATTTAALFANAIDDFWSVSNAYFDGTNFKYVATGTATGYEQANGHKWYTAPSGTAGNAISFSQVMTLDASGRLVVGATVAEARLHAATSNPTNGVVQLLQNLSLSSQTGAKTQYDVGNVGTSGIGIPDGSSNALSFFVGGMTSASERARITSGGNMLLGTTSDDGSRLRIKSYYNFGSKNTAIYIDGGDVSTPDVGVSGGYISQDVVGGLRTEQGATYFGGGPWRTDPQSTTYSAAAFSDGAIKFFTNSGLTANANFTPTERARIDSSGNLLIGTTSQIASARSVIAGSGSNAQVIYFNNTRNNGSGDATAISLLGAADDNTSNYHFIGTTGGNDRVFIFGNGNIQNTNNSYGAISDAKLKENVTDATPKLDKLNQIRVVNFNMIGSEQKQLGVIAQELEQIFPGMVDESPDTDKDGNDLGTTTKSVKYSVFVPMLIKAMQEQQAIINSLKARLDAANL
jgi:hypothetical protein